MSSTLNLSLTDELRAFVNENCGDGTLYATPSEFVRDLLRRQKQRQEVKLPDGPLLQHNQSQPIPTQHMSHHGTARNS